MIIKKYLVANMNEALTRIRYELGKDAVIISQRKVKRPGISGMFSKRLIEVTAAIENQEKDTSNKKNEDSFKSSIEDIKRVMEKEIINKNQETVKEKSLDTNKNDLEREVREMKELLNKVIRNTSKEESENPIEEFLESTDLSPKLLSKKIEDYEDINKIKAEILDSINITEEDLSRNVVLVGPTGVGKTTTIAKLAGRLALIEKKKVGLITIDTYRIGAVEQLKTYAEIMNLSFKVVITIKEMEEAVDEMSHCDVVLIDTTGRNSKNFMQLSELRAFVQKSKASTIKLVMSGTTKNKDIETISKGYEDLGYDSLIITKLDETTSYGGVYNILKTTNKPLSFITTGQDVPDDIKTPTKEEVYRLILGEDEIC